MPTSDKPQKITLGGKIRFRVTNAIRTALLSCSDLNAVLSSGITIQLDSYADWIIYNEIFVDGEYKNAVEFYFSRLLNASRPNFVDLGANVGFFTLYLIDALRQRNASAQFRIKAVEGSPTIYRDLQSRISGQARSGEQIELYNGLLGKRSGSGTLFEFGYHAMASVTPRRFSRGVVVPFLDLDAICSDFESIDLLKCDIEGAEEALLSNWRSVFQKTKCAVFELHPQDCDTNACIVMLTELGFSNRKVLRSGKASSIELFWR